MNPAHHLTPGLDDELNWLAFRYVVGELTEAEIESFEARLTDDLAACEAVAAISELAIGTQAALLSEKPVPARRFEDPRSLSVRIRTWLAVSATAVALGWLFLLLGKGNDPTAVETPAAVIFNESQAAADLIARWSQPDESEFTAEFPEIVPLEMIGADESVRPEIPTWMIAAVTLETTGSPSGERADMPSDMNAAETKEN